MNVNSTADLLELQHTLNTTSNSNLDGFLRRPALPNGQPAAPSNTIFWLDDLLAKIDLMQNRGEHLGTLLGNITFPLKPHCGNVNLSAYHWRMYNLFLVLIQYFIPLIVITFAYTKMGLKLRETDKRLNKRSSSKLQRINTTSSGGGFSSSSVRTTNNNLIVSPGTANCNVQMAIELQQTGGQPMGAIGMGANKRCRSLDCSPLGEGACLMAHDRKCSQSTTPTGRYSPQCFNCHTHVTQMNSTHRTSCTECCREMQLMNNATVAHNTGTQNAAGRSKSCNASMKKGACKCNACKCKACKCNARKCRRYETDPQQAPFEHCVHCGAGGQQQHYNSLHRYRQSPQQPPLHHHSSLQPTGSIHSNLMMPMISHPITALRVNSHAEYIIINKKKVGVTFVHRSAFECYY